MKHYIIFLLFLVFTFQINAQTNRKEFWKQSTPIKVWIITHPFKAKKAQLISLEIKRVTDSIAKTDLLDGDKFGGQVDAFRHAYWMASLRQEIGKYASFTLGKAYERSNKKAFKKSRRKGIASGCDKPSKKMDLFNNKVGLSFSNREDSISVKSLIYKITNAIFKRELKVIKKDSLGNYLTCTNQIISTEELFNKWRNNKCLVSSNLVH